MRSNVILMFVVMGIYCKTLLLILHVLVNMVKKYNFMQVLLGHGKVALPYVCEMCYIAGRSLACNVQKQSMKTGPRRW
jgi:ABC-type spermidine/putrescine transport system permease subunit II